MGRTWWAWARLAGGAVILIALVRTLGTGPFAAGVRTLDVTSLVAAAGIAAVTTVCCAWRWSLVARGLGVAVPLPAAIAAYYRSQFLNTALPGGVLGDLHRGIAHGRGTGNVGRGLRAVGWERLAGQLVQAGLAVLVLLALPSPVRAAMPAVLAGIAVIAGIAAAVPLAARLAGVLPRPTRSDEPSRWVRVVRAAGADLRGITARRAWPGIVAASVVVVAGHAATFLIAARAVGVTAPPDELLPLALLALLGMAVPANIGGWGPREGVTAWLFGSAGLGAAQGLATAVAYGVLALVASLPGALVLAAGWAAGRQPPPAAATPAGAARKPPATPAGAAHEPPAATAGPARKPPAAATTAGGAGG